MKDIRSCKCNKSYFSTFQLRYLPKSNLYNCIFYAASKASLLFLNIIRLLCNILMIFKFLFRKDKQNKNLFECEVHLGTNMMLSEIWPLPEMGKFLRIRKAKSIDFHSVMLISQGIYEGKKTSHMKTNNSLEKRSFCRIRLFAIYL